MHVCVCMQLVHTVISVLLCPQFAQSMAFAMWSCPLPPVRPLCCGSWKTCANTWRVTVFSARSPLTPTATAHASTTEPNQVGRYASVLERKNRKGNVSLTKSYHKISFSTSNSFLSSLKHHEMKETAPESIPDCLLYTKLSANSSFGIKSSQAKILLCIYQCIFWRVVLLC